ncbi:hypothetical protein BDN72DRAFT_748301, partial [Pluteus cervinus]
SRISSPRMKWGGPNGQRRCPNCGLQLLTGEKPGFCCRPRRQSSRPQPLPPLPDEFAPFLCHPDLSRLSRVLNLVFSFASLETTHPFPAMDRARSFVSIQGRVYHR